MNTKLKADTIKELFDLENTIERLLNEDIPCELCFLPIETDDKLKLLITAFKTAAENLLTTLQKSRYLRVEISDENTEEFKTTMTHLINTQRSAYDNY